MTETSIIRRIVRSVVGLLAAAILAYPLDWAVWRCRVALGGGMGTVQIDRFTVAELKGGKETYYFDGSDAVDCSRSVLPEAGSGACWWIARHHEVIERY